MNTPWAQVRETHTGVVFLAGDRAYKIKKPVDLGFCDFTSLQAREAVCLREVELNRRLAPDVYLGVAELHMPDGHGTEPVVVMRRMADEDRLAARVARGTVGVEDVRAIAHVLASFHDRCATGPAVADQATPAALARRWDANLAEMAPFAGTVLDRSQLDAIATSAQEWIAGRAPLLERRIATGRIVDGHGDLLADDIFLLPDGPRILDCLEFDDRLRSVDRIDEVAFLAMDLERLDAAHLARALVHAYREFGGDTTPSSLVHHYIAYRALVRAKVACLRHAQGAPEARRTAIELLDLTQRHLELAAPRLVLVGGPPGTGKSTLAGALADRLGATVVATDRVRKELAGMSPNESAAAALGEGLYTSDSVDKVYDEVLRRARALLGVGETVILDATWSTSRHREAAAEVAAATHSPLAALRCTVPARIAAGRTVGRAGPSDADPAIALALAARTEPWAEARAVDTATHPSPALGQAVEAVLAARYPVPLGTPA